MKAEIDVSVGDIIFYRLEPRDLPVNPEKVWKGKVELAHSKKCLFVAVSSFIPASLDDFHKAVSAMCLRAAHSGGVCP